MIKVLSVTLFTLLLFTTGQLPSAYAQEGRKREAEAMESIDGLQISIGLDGKQFRMGDTLKLKVELKNVGDVPLAIHKDVGWYGDSSFGLSITDERGRPVMPTFLGENFPTSPIPEEEFIILKQGESREQERLLLLERYMFEGPGDYSLTARYWGPTKHFVPESLKDRVWGGGPLTSRPVKFEVVKKE